MPSQICELQTYEFRNLENALWNVDSTEVFFTGKNGQGKTNFLEAIYLICSGSSFRTRTAAHLCRHGSVQSRVSGKFTEDVISVEITGKQRILSQNERKITDRRTLLRQFPCIVFVHEDIAFVTGSPGMQRQYMDQCLSISQPRYLDSLRKYKDILQRKNAVLKTTADKKVIAALNLQLVQYGLPIQEWRRSLIADIAPTIAERYRTISRSDVPLEINYQASWKKDSSEALLNHLAQAESYELLTKTSTSGPHRDQLRVLLNRRPIETLASMGQLRAISLVYRIIQAELVLAHYHQSPILLFDDVLLELDVEKKESFNAIIPSFSQAFFTFLGYEHFESFQHHDAKIYTVQEGKLLHENT